VQIYTLDIVPIPKGRPRVTKAGIGYTPKRTREYEQKLKNFLFIQCRLPPLNEAVTILIDIRLPKLKSSTKSTWPTPIGDIDNYAKAILDAANGILFTDDRLIDNLTLRKQYSKTPGITLTIKLTEEK
jgi:Holliday junction resolvase RusA-like endonuclease